MLITRTATPEDAAAISALIGQLSAELTIYPDGRGAALFFQSVTPEAEYQYLTDPRYAFTLMLDGEQVVACIAMRDRTHLFHLFVARAYQHQGLASKLWQTVLRQNLTYTGESCFTVNASIIALGFYERIGFRRVADEVRMHGIRFVPMSLQVNNALQDCANNHHH